VSIPPIADDLGSTSATLTWVITGPLLALGVVGPAFGKAGDLWGHRRMYLIGMAGAALFAALTALAWSAPALIVFRTLGASAGAAAGPASMALINSIFPRDRRVQAMGWWSLVMAGGPVLGVVAGGPVVEQFGWRWIFAAQVPMTLVGFLLAAAILPETVRRAKVAFDWRGALTLGVGVTGLLLALNRGPILGWSSPWVVGGLVAAPLLLGLFFLIERRADSPLIPMGYLRRRNFAFPIAVQFCTNFAYMGSFILTPLLLQDVLDYSTTKTGLLSIARPLSFAITGPIAGYLAMRIGERASAVFGASLVVLAMIVMSAVGVGSPDVLVIGGLALAGVGLGASSPSMAATIANAVDEHDLGVAGAAQQMVAQVGVVAGIQIMQTVQQSRAEDIGVVASYGDGFLIGGLVALFGVAAAAFVRSSSATQPEAMVAETRRTAPQAHDAVLGG